MADKIKHGTAQRGEMATMAKLKGEDISRIRAMAGAMLQREIARVFGVTEATISRVLSGERWAGACPLAQQSK
jgi:DNA-binding transcriptional regulator YiaG